jgi:hypothetical protein
MYLKNYKRWTQSGRNFKIEMVTELNRKKWEVIIVSIRLLFLAVFCDFLVEDLLKYEYKLSLSRQADYAKYLIRSIK